MVDLDDLGLGELDTNALSVTAIVGGILALFLLGDPLNAGMESIPLATRIIAVIVMLPIGYFVAMRMLNK